jgi:translation elongation factor EF-G
VQDSGEHVILTAGELHLEVRTLTSGFGVFVCFGGLCDAG